ncbi:hypothetical protein LCGC14_2527190, partial [marine sediment metagenome]
ITADNFFGLANNSDKLDGIDSTQFLRSDINDTLEAFTLYPNGTNPILLNHLVNKEFVELAVAGLELDYFFTNATSDISGYFVLNNTDRNSSETIVESASLSSGNNQLIFNCSTEAGLPFIFLSEGIYDAHIHLVKTGGAAQTIIPRWTLSKRNSSGEFFLMESETSDIQITTTKRKFDLHSVFDGDIKIVSTDRLVFKLFVDITGGGSSTVSLSMEGTTDSHFTFRTPSSVLEAIFLRRDGRNSPTGDISWGGFDLDNVGIANIIDGIHTSNITADDGTLEIIGSLDINNTLQVDGDTTLGDGNSATLVTIFGDQQGVPPGAGARGGEIFIEGVTPDGGDLFMWNSGGQLVLSDSRQSSNADKGRARWNVNGVEGKLFTQFVFSPDLTDGTGTYTTWSRPGSWAVYDFFSDEHVSEGPDVHAGIRLRLNTEGQATVIFSLDHGDFGDNTIVSAVPGGNVAWGFGTRSGNMEVRHYGRLATVMRYAFWK